MKTDSHKAWTKPQLPEKILAIRLHALGDSIAAIAALQNLRDQLPAGTIVDLVIKKEYSEIPESLNTFNTIYKVSGFNYKTQALSLLPSLPKIIFKRYDAVLDLQNNKISNYLRKLINPGCYVEFDRFSAKHGCVRTAETIEKAGLVKITGSGFDITDKTLGQGLLDKYGIKKHERVIVLNPAGAFLNRNWPVENYLRLASLLIEEYGNSIRFVMLGTNKILEKALYLEKKSGDRFVNLVTKTSQAEALALIQEIELMISEDGALLHMAYLSNKNTVGIIGSTRSDWTDPKLPHTIFFNSDDMACGNCMLYDCKYGTNECMVRVSPEMVFEKAKLFLNT